MTKSKSGQRVWVIDFGSILCQLVDRVCRVSSSSGSELLFDVEEFDKYNRRLFLTQKEAEEYLKRPKEDDGLEPSFSDHLSDPD